MSKRICCKNCVYEEPCLICEDHSEFFDVRNKEPDVESVEVKFLGSLPVLNQTVHSVSGQKRYNKYSKDMRER